MFKFKRQRKVHMSTGHLDLKENRDKRIVLTFYFWHLEQKNVERPAMVLLVMGEKQVLQGFPCLP